MYNSGMSVSDVAGMYGMSRQAMHKILKRRDVQFRSQLKFGNDNYFYRDGAEQDKRVHNVVMGALGNGKLIPEPCEKCGTSPDKTNGRCVVHAHHDDYNKPLDVRWLCQPCHFEWHKHNKPIRRTVGLPPMSQREVAAMGGRSPRRK